ncbi:MAG TPA: thiamine phosphate synthase, partial [Bacteroidia bacterium]|nr:thiamine phosphate synthase [Bacteroidia bacterium]
EHKIINALFDEGLTIFHMRKMDYSEKELNHLIMKIDKEHHTKVAFHQHHRLADHFGSNRLHFTEQERKKALLEVNEKGRKQYILSTSIHHAGAYAALPDIYDYCFLSPVFNSISKPDLKSMITPDFKLPVKSGIKLIALGGVSASGIPEVKNYDFDGIAVLGTIWNEPEKAIANFKKLKAEWGSYGQQY